MSGACERDGNPAAAGSYLCEGCTRALVAGLNSVPGLLVDLDVTLARQARIGERGPRSGTEQPLPYSVAASEAHGGLVRVVRIAYALAGQDGRLGAPGAPRAALWLARHAQLLAGRPGAAWTVDAVLDVVAAAVEAVDRPQDRAYAGICWAPLVGGGQCAADLYGPAGSGVVVCAACGARHDADRRRAWLLAEVDDELAYASQLARAVTGLGAEVSADRVRKWAERGRIVAQGTDARNRPLYRVGDVLDVLREDITRRQASA